MCLATLSARYPEASPPSYWLSQPGPAGSRPGAPCLLEAPLEKQTPCGHSPTPGTHQGGVPVHPFALLSDCPLPSTGWAALLEDPALSSSLPAVSSS